MATSTLTPSSFHPALRVTFPSGFFSAGPSSTCDPYLLLSLPPALFLDPWQEPIHPVLQAQAQALNAATASKSDRKASSSAAGVRVEQVEFLSAGYPSQVELEKAVGWTGADAGSSGAYSGLGVWQGKEESTRIRQSSSTDYDEILSSVGAGAGSKKKHTNREREAVLLRLSTPSSPAGSSKEKLRLPLHARYLPPVGSSQASLASRLLSPSGSGNYIEVGIEGLEVFWACTAGSAPRDLEEEEQWESVPRLSSLLPSTHLHLLSPLLSNLPPRASIYKPSSSSSLGAESQGAMGLPSIFLPTGDAELAQFTWGATQAVIWIVAIWILTRVRSLG